MTAEASPASSGAVVLTEERIRAECRARGGYWTPELNEKLYLHHLGVSTLGGLHTFTGCTVLYLSHNALSDLAPLACLSQLKMLYLSHNALQSCASLPALPQLITLDVSYNSLSDMCGITAGTTPQLVTLLLAHNQLRALDATASSSVFTLPSLTSVDASHNQLLEADSAWPALLQAAQNEDGGALATCDFSGNAWTRTMPSYRKRVIALLPRLRFLDGLPIEASERLRSEAFVRGGADEEKRVRAELEAREATEKQQRFAYLTDTRAAAAERRQSEAHRQNGVPSTYFLTQVEPDTDNDDDDIYVPS